MRLTRLLTEMVDRAARCAQMPALAEAGGRRFVIIQIVILLPRSFNTKASHHRTRMEQRVAERIV